MFNLNLVFSSSCTWRFIMSDQHKQIPEISAPSELYSPATILNSIPGALDSRVITTKSEYLEAQLETKGDCKTDGISEVCRAKQSTVWKGTNRKFVKIE